MMFLIEITLFINRFTEFLHFELNNEFLLLVSKVTSTFSLFFPLHMYLYVLNDHDFVAKSNTK